MAEICKHRSILKIKTASKFKGPHVECVEVRDFLQVVRKTQGMAQL